MCQKALYDLSYGYRQSESDTLSSLEPWQLSELYVWLRNYKYQKEGTVSTQAGSMEDYSYLTLDNYIINRLIKLATLESMKALKYIQKNLKDEHKQYFKYHINRAEEERQRKYWQRLTPEEVIKLSWEEKRRMFIIKLEILFFILCVLNIVVCLIFKGVTANELVQKLWGSYWTLFTLINTAAICIWYWLLSEEEKESFKQKIREFVGWRT